MRSYFCGLAYEIIFSLSNNSLIQEIVFRVCMLDGYEPFNGIMTIFSIIILIFVGASTIRRISHTLMTNCQY